MERGELAAHLRRAGNGAGPASGMVEEADPHRFMASFAEAVGGNGNIFLVNPAWRALERDVLSRLPDSPCGEEGWLMIPSGGSSGGLKFARHDAHTIEAAVQGFRAHFGIEKVHSVCVLPLCHVSGFMAWMRSALSDGSFFPLDWKVIESGRLPTGTPPGCCLSLVPTQLQRLLGSRDAIDWLRRFKVISLGGAPAWESILKEAADHGLPLAPSYGATETAAMATSLLPEEFLNGRRGCGRALPHVQVGVGVDGEVRVSGPSIFRGYFPATRAEREWVSGDIGTMESGGFLSILGRSDDLIITGGKKVSPSEVEAVLRSSGEFADVAVIGLPDVEWGQEVVALYPGDQPSPDLAKVNAALSGLASFKRPKRLADISPWPRNAQGKLDRAELQRLAAKGG